MTGLIVVVLRAVARQIEEGIRYLQKEYKIDERVLGCFDRCRKKEKISMGLSVREGDQTFFYNRRRRLPYLV